MTTLQLLILLFGILAAVVVFGLSLYLYEYRRVQKLISKQLVASASLNQIKTHPLN